MSKPFKILLIFVAVLLSIGLVYGTYEDIRGGSPKTQEGIDAVDEAMRELDKFKE
jgi:hypothetical protein